MEQAYKQRISDYTPQTTYSNSLHLLNHYFYFLIGLVKKKTKNYVTFLFQQQVSNLNKFPNLF